jgi:hypothetical protein
MQGHYRQFITKSSQEGALPNSFSFFNVQLLESQLSYSKSMHQLFEKLQLKQTCPKCVAGAVANGPKFLTGQVTRGDSL